MAKGKKNTFSTTASPSCAPNPSPLPTTNAHPSRPPSREHNQEERQNNFKRQGGGSSRDSSQKSINGTKRSKSIPKRETRSLSPVPRSVPTRSDTGSSTLSTNSTTPHLWLESNPGLGDAIKNSKHEKVSRGDPGSGAGAFWDKDVVVPPALKGQQGTHNINYFKVEGIVSPRVDTVMTAIGLGFNHTSSTVATKEPHIVKRPGKPDKRDSGISGWFTGGDNAGKSGIKLGVQPTAPPNQQTQYTGSEPHGGNLTMEENVAIFNRARNEPRFQQDKYDVLQANCNDFTNVTGRYMHHNGVSPPTGHDRLARWVTNYYNKEQKASDPQLDPEQRGSR